MLVSYNQSDRDTTRNCIFQYRLTGESPLFQRIGEKDRRGGIKEAWVHGEWYIPGRVGEVLHLIYEEWKLRTDLCFQNKPPHFTDPSFLPGPGYTSYTSPTLRKSS